jgi:hypothetical protein
MHKTTDYRFNIESARFVRMMHHPVITKRQLRLLNEYLFANIHIAEK